MIDILNNDYYKAATTLLFAIGRWPYQTKREKYFFGTLFVLPCVIQLFGEITILIVYPHDTELRLESFSPLILDTVVILKYTSVVINYKRVKRLFDQVKHNWINYDNEDEQNILHMYAQYGRIYAQLYMGAAYTSTIVYILEPQLPRLLNFIMNTNETVPLRYPLPVYWIGVDMVENYAYAVSFSSFCIITFLTIEIALDAMFIVLLQHAAGLFAVTGHMMEYIPTKDDLIYYIKRYGDQLSLEDIKYKHYARCIESHKSAINFVEDIEAIYVWCFGAIVILNIPVMSVTAIQVTTQSANIEQQIKYAMFAACQLAHVLVICYFSQQIITNSLNIQQHICNGLWYECTMTTQKLLTLVTLRSQRECKLTAGKAVILSIETFTVIVKTAVSYYTILGTMR